MHRTGAAAARVESGRCVGIGQIDIGGAGAARSSRCRHVRQSNLRAGGILDCPRGVVAGRWIGWAGNAVPTGEFSSAAVVRHSVGFEFTRSTRVGPVLQQAQRAGFSVSSRYHDPVHLRTYPRRFALHPACCTQDAFIAVMEQDVHRFQRYSPP